MYNGWKFQRNDFPLHFFQAIDYFTLTSVEKVTSGKQKNK